MVIREITTTTILGHILARRGNINCDAARRMKHRNRQICQPWGTLDRFGAQVCCIHSAESRRAEQRTTHLPTDAAPDVSSNLLLRSVGAIGFARLTRILSTVASAHY